LKVEFLQHVVGKAALAGVTERVMRAGLVDVRQDAAERQEGLFGRDRVVVR
jgi:hypothetical protein